MLTLIIYDNEGVIISERSGEPAPREPIGIPFMWVEIPQDKRVVGVNTSITPHQPIYEDIPLNDFNQLKQDLEKEKASRLELEGAVMELTSILAMQGGNV